MTGFHDINIVMASAPQSNGVTRAYSKAVYIGAPGDAAQEPDAGA